MADYAISNVDRRIVYTGSAGVGPYAFNFEVLDQTDIAVYKNTTLLVLTTNYTVSINPSTGVGSVTLNVAATSSDTITIVGARAIQRTTDFTTGGDLFANSLNDELDSLTIFSQQVAETAERGIKAPVTDPTNINMTLPAKADRIDSLLKFDLNGNPGVISVTDFVSGFSGAILGANYVTTNATGDGSTTAFTVSSAPGDKGNIQIYLDGVYQNKNTFSISGTTVTFTEAPPVGSAIEFVVGYSLGSTSGADAVTYTPAGTGAQTTTVQTKLREIVSRSDYNSDVNFNAAVGNKPNIDGSNNFDAKVTPSGENAQINLSQAILTVTTSNRAAIRYNTSTSVSISSPRHILMGGFRFFGQYTKARAPVFSRTSGGQQTVSLSTNLGAESAAHLDGWYAVFACANDGDATPSFKLMPCLRAGSVSGSSITLCSAAEGIHSNTATTYAWSSTNNLNGVECLVINETVDGRNNAFSGRVTTITANTTTSITLATIGTVGAFDWLLPAPPGFDHYCYQGMFYYETPGDVRNIADSGQLVKAKMINNVDPNWSATGAIGSIASPVSIDFGGYISPLATGVVVKEVASFSTASLGTYAAYIDIDGSQHVVQTNFGQKEGTPTETMIFDNITIPFCFKQTFYYSNTGSLISLRSGGTLEIVGWIEN